MPRTDIDPNQYYDQNWDEFDNIYIDFNIEYVQQLFVHNIASMNFHSFPQNLPPDLIVPVIAHRHQVIVNEMQRRGIELEIEDPEQEETDEFFRQVAQEPLDDIQTLIGQLYESIYTLSRFGKKLEYDDYPDFESVIHTQHVISMCAFAEGFLTRIVRYCANRPPNPFAAWRAQHRNRRQSHISPNELMDRYLFEMSRGDFNTKLDNFENTHGVVFGRMATQIADIKDLFLLRNHLIHNAGQTSVKLVNESSRWSQQAIGVKIPLIIDEIDAMFDSLIDVSYQVYRDCSMQLFQKIPSQLFIAPQRGQPPTAKLLRDKSAA